MQSRHLGAHCAWLFSQICVVGVTSSQLQMVSSAVYINQHQPHILEMSTFSTVQPFNQSSRVTIMVLQFSLKQAKCPWDLQALKSPPFRNNSLANHCFDANSLGSGFCSSLRVNGLSIIACLLQRIKDLMRNFSSRQNVQTANCPRRHAWVYVWMVTWTFHSGCLTITLTYFVLFWLWES